MKNIIIILLSTCCFIIHGFSQQIEKAETGIFLLKNGRVESPGQGLIDADVLIADGKIMEVTSNIIHPGAKQIDCQGLLIYPGMIDAGTRLGLAEIGSISLTQDHNELGEFTPHMEALTAINPSSVNIPVTRVNGITTVLTVPSRGKFPGTAALINLHGYTPQQMYAGFKGMVFNFPTSGKRGSRDRRSDEEIAKADKKSQKEVEDFLAKARLYRDLKLKADNQNEFLKYNPQLEAMIPVLEKEMPLLIEVNKKKDILSAIEWTNENDLKVIFTGVAEGYLVADSLSKYSIPVITGPVLSNPSRSSDRYDVAYKNAGVMIKAGVKVALRTNETENVRNLPYNAGFAATYGLGWREAFKAVTSNPAEIFGVDDMYGTIERGKVANLFVADGDPFETKTQIQFLFINGFQIPLESRHTRLYDEFLERNP